MGRTSLDVRPIAMSGLSESVATEGKWGLPLGWLDSAGGVMDLTRSWWGAGRGNS